MAPQSVAPVIVLGVCEGERIACCGSSGNQKADRTRTERGDRDEDSSDDPEIFWTMDPKFTHFRRGVYTPVGDKSGDNSKVSLGQARKQASNAEEAIQCVVESLLAKTSSVLMIPADEMSPKRSVASYGLDSLVAVEIRNCISKERAKVPLLALLSSPSIEALASTIANESNLVNRGMFAAKEAGLPKPPMRA